MTSGRSTTPPLATWLVPVLALAFIAGLLMLGRPAVTPGSPPGLRTPEGTTPVTTSGHSVPQSISRETGVAEMEESALPAPGPAPTPDAPVFPGATYMSDTPYWRYTVKGEFDAVRDYYLGHFGKQVQYAESVIPATGKRRAICFVSGEPEAVQISETDDAGVIDLAIGPLAALRAP